MIGLKSKKGEKAVDRQKDIMRFIERNPGMHLREMQRRLSLSSMGNLEYHINNLRKLKLIVEEADSGYKRYYPAKGAVKNKELLALMRQKLPRRIALLIIEKMRKEGCLEVRNGNADLSDNANSVKTAEGENDPSKCGLTPHELMGDLGLSASALSYYLSKMRKGGILKREKRGKNVFYIALAPQELLLVIVSYRESFMDGLVNSFMEIWGL